MATLLLKKSYQLSNLKEVPFNDLWGSKGIFTTIRMVGKPPKLLLLKLHIENLLKSSKKYVIKKKNLKNVINNLIKQNTLYQSQDNLLRIALNKKFISISIRKRLKPKKNFNLLIFRYQRIEPKYKNLYYKKILSKLSKIDSTKFDIVLVSNNKILETCTANLIFVKNKKLFTPKNNCYFGNTLKFMNKKVKIKFKEIYINEIKDFDEIILIGSGKGIISVSKIKELNWERRNDYYYKKLNIIYRSLFNYEKS
tara:strand:- start:2 stop:760 length:759 start_codon:yes stop_codon:yes gene_type:complete